MRVLSRLLIALPVLGIVSAGCGQPGSPAGPVGSPFSESALRRIVQDVSGGGSELCPTCLSIRGTITVDASVGTLSAAYPGNSSLDGLQKIGIPSEFTILNGLSAPSMTATGHVAEYELRRFSLSVSAGRASLSMVLNSPPPEFAFSVTGTSVPAFRIVSDSSCSSGQRIETTAVFHLEHLGRTELRDSHCVAT